MTLFRRALIPSLALIVSLTLSEALVSPEPSNAKNALKQELNSALPTSEGTLSRRGLLSAGLAGLLLLETNGSPASAFDNKVSNQYDDRPKRRGSKVSHTLWLIVLFNYSRI